MEPAENHHAHILSTIGATLLLTTSLLVTACSPSNSYRVTIENRNNQPVEEFLLEVADETISLGKLQPGERRERELKINRNSTIGKQGTVTIIDETHHTGTRKAADKPQRQEWALPCMIPG